MTHKLFPDNCDPSRWAVYTDDDVKFNGDKRAPVLRPVPVRGGPQTNVDNLQQVSAGMGIGKLFSAV